MFADRIFIGAPLAAANLYVYRVSSCNDFLLEILGSAIIFSFFPLCYPFTSVYAFVPRDWPKATVKASDTYLLFFFQQSEAPSVSSPSLLFLLSSESWTPLPFRGRARVEGFSGWKERQKGRKKGRILAGRISRAQNLPVDFIIPMDFPFKDTVPWLFYGICLRAKQTTMRPIPMQRSGRLTTRAFANEANSSVFIRRLFLFATKSSFSTVCYNFLSPAGQ